MDSSVVLGNFSRMNGDANEGKTPGSKGAVRSSLFTAPAAAISPETISYTIGRVRRANTLTNRKAKAVRWSENEHRRKHMKHSIQLVAVLFTVASAGMAFGCGCSSTKVRVEPVREQIIQSSSCNISQPIVSSRTTYVPECPSCYWVPPKTDNAAYAIGNVLTAPLRLVTGRSLGQPDVVSTHSYLEPVGEKITKVTTSSKRHFTKCGMTKKVTIRSESMLAPVGEQLTTVKVIRTKPMLMPVAEQITTVRHIEMQPVLEPVSERVIIRRAPLCPQSCGFGD